MTRMLYAAMAVAVVVSTQPLATSQSAGTGLPARLENYLTNVVKPTPAERKKLLAGAPITTLLDADASKEVAVFGAIWIKAPIRRYVEAVQDIETFERGAGFKVTKRISTPPTLEDFAQLNLPPDDVEDLRTCRVGSCELKLGEQSLQRFRTEINWKAPNARSSVDALMQQLAFEYVTGYLDGGNERLAVYRDSARPTFVSEEFRSMIDQMPELTTYMPDMRRYLLGFPRVSLPGTTLYWQETEFGSA